MKSKMLYALWAALFILCAGLGFIPEPGEKLQLLLTLLSVFFFLPPAGILYCSGKNRNAADCLLVRNLAGMSLGLTLLVLILNFLTALRSEFLGLVLHYILVIVSSPMICSGHWALSLFLWACLLTASFRQLRR